MLGSGTFRPDPESHLALRNGIHADLARHTPRNNHLLAALPRDDYEHLLPYLEPIPLPLGWAVYGSGERQKYLYFITAGTVSQLYVTKNGESAEFAVTGTEGVIGTAAFLGGESTPGCSEVVMAGDAYRVQADLIKKDPIHNGPLMHLLLRQTRSLLVQTAQIAACNRHHSVHQQLCRWILSRLDRTPSNEMAVTHELIAAMLGVRRESVTTAAGNLQDMGLIHQSRCHITVLDRFQLEAQACECYGVVKREAHQFIGPEQYPRQKQPPWKTLNRTE